MPSSTLARSRKQRSGSEFVCERVFRPLAHPLVLVLARLRVPPPVVVAASGVTGVVAAVELGRGSLVAAALLIQLKTVFDNADGQLARLTGRTSAFGRYLDSEVDLVVNAALFAALGARLAAPALALAGFLAVTTVLSVNFNAERLSRNAAAGPDGGGSATALLRGVYRAVYGPQDRLAEWIVARRPSVTSSRAVSLLANAGMSTQLAVFGLCLALGHPLAFAWLAVAQAAVLALFLLPQRATAREETA